MICCQDTQTFFRIKVHKNFEDESFIKGEECNVPAFKKERKGHGQSFICIHTCSTPTHHSPTLIFTPSIFSLLADHLFSSFNFLSFLFTHTHLCPTLSHRVPLQTTISPSFFPQDHQKILRNL